MNDDKYEMKTPEQAGQWDAQDYRKGEIDFFDIWMILIKRWRIVFCLWAIVSLIGVFNAVKKPVMYSYSATINIGGGGVENPTIEKPTIESLETVSSKLLNVFIPQAVREDMAKNGNEKQMSLDVKIPSNSSLIILEGKGTEEEENRYISLIQTVVEKIVKNHEPRTGVIRKALNAERAIAERQLQGYEDNFGFLSMELARLDESSKLLKKQIDRTSEILEKLEDGRRVAVTTLKDEPDAMTLLMIDAQILEGRKHLSKMENEFFIGTESKRNRQKKDIASNQRQIENQKDLITKIEGRIFGLSETHAVAPPMKSLKPLKSKRLSTIALSAFVGLILGVFGVFLAEFISKTKQLLQRENQRAAL